MDFLWANEPRARLQRGSHPVLPSENGLERGKGERLLARAFRPKSSAGPLLPHCRTHGCEKTMPLRQSTEAPQERPPNWDWSGGEGYRTRLCQGGVRWGGLSKSHKSPPLTPKAQGRAAGSQPSAAGLEALRWGAAEKLGGGRRPPILAASRRDSKANFLTQPKMVTLRKNSRTRLTTLFFTANVNHTS